MTYVINKGTLADIYVSRSTDDGLTWLDAGKPGSVRFNTIGLQRQPSTTAASDGSLVSIWEGVIPDKSQLGIYFARSADKGLTWTAPALVAENGLGFNQDFSSIAAGPDGNVYVTYLSFDAQGGDGRTHVFLSKSVDNGATWNAPTRVDSFEVGGSCECCIQNVAVGPSGEIAIAFRSNVNDVRDIYIVRSADEAKSFGKPIKIQDEEWNIFGCPSTGPSLVFDATGTIHITWRDARDNVDRNVAYYSQLDVDGTAGTPNIDLSTSVANEGEYPSVCTSPDGQEIVIIMETSRGLYQTTSFDGGKTFTPKELDHTVVRSSSAHAVWTQTQGPVLCWRSDRDGKADVRLANGIVSSVGEDDVSKTPPSVKFIQRDVHLSGFENGQYRFGVYNIVGSQLYESTIEIGGIQSSVHVPNISANQVMLYRLTTMQGDVTTGILIAGEGIRSMNTFWLEGR